MKSHLCKNLQSINCDLFEAVKHLETIINELENLLENMNQTFQSIFEKAELFVQYFNEQDKLVAKTHFY